MHAISYSKQKATQKISTAHCLIFLPLKSYVISLLVVYLFICMLVCQQNYIKKLQAGLAKIFR